MASVGKSPVQVTPPPHAPPHAPTWGGDQDGGTPQTETDNQICSHDHVLMHRWIIISDRDIGITLICVFGCYVRYYGAVGGGVKGYYTNHSVNVPIRLSVAWRRGPHLSEPQSVEIMSHYQIII